MMHKDLASGRWNELSLFEQLANIGSDVERTISWRNRGNKEYSDKAFERVLELLYLTIADPKNHEQLKEVVRAKECLIDYFWCDNEYQTTDEFWQKYFYGFAYAVAIQRGR